jgi:hypothetical protein
MTRHRLRAVALILTLTLPVSTLAVPDLTDKTKEAWKSYISLTEKRVDGELRQATPSFRSNLADLKSGQLEISPRTTPGTKGKSIPDGRIHHWLGAVFIPNKKVDDLISWLENYSQYKDYFKDVDDSQASRTGEEFDVYLRLKRSKLGKTAHFSTKHKVVYTRRAPGFVSSVNRSYEIHEIANAGHASERLLPEGRDNGYLWGLNSYWRFFERDGGVVVECETVGLSRDLGWGLGLLNFLMLGKVQSIADSIAREALESMLTDLRDGSTGGPKKPSAK